jgi:hypothetical protein
MARQRVGAVPGSADQYDRLILVYGGAESLQESRHDSPVRVHKGHAAASFDHAGFTPFLGATDIDKRHGFLQQSLKGLIVHGEQQYGTDETE